MDQPDRIWRGVESLHALELLARRGAATAPPPADAATARWHAHSRR
jgi:hypothetical protein